MPKALVIDDEAALTDIIGRFLTGAGFEVVTATSGPEGIRKALETEPDVVIVDVMMPEMDGYEVCRRLRRDPRTAQATIVVLTARGQHVDREIAMRAGADAHLAKPYQGKILIQEIRQLLAPRLRTTPPLGYQILVLRLRESVGATTLATNLGLSLAGDRRQMVAVADMALNGQVEIYLGLPPTRTWQEGLGSDADRLASQLVRHDSGLFALPAPPAGVGLPEPAKVQQILQKLREWHDYLLVDTPYNLGAMAPVLLQSSPLVLLLLTPDPAVLKTAKTSLAAIRHWSNRLLQIWPVLNMVRPEEAALQRRVEEALELPVAAILPWSPQECAQAVVQGKPVVLGSPEAPLAEAFRKLARQVVEEVETQPLRRIPR